MTAPQQQHQLRMRKRYRRITRFAARFLAQTWWYELALPRLRLSSITTATRTRRMQRFARNFHDLAVDLGGLMIKVGQFMSSRLDVLPPEITKELEGLQDEVPAVDFASIRQQIERELDCRLDEAFDTVDEQPLAAASLGQTHRVRLHEVDAIELGFADAVIKVQRPGIEDIVDVDLAALTRIGGWLSRIKLVSRRVDAPALVREFATTSREEIDYFIEASNVERFAELFENDPRVRVPQVVWERSARRVLTLEDVSAIKIANVDAIREAGIDPDDVASTFADVMFDQLFEFGFFHGDPHPGNLFVTPVEDDANGVGWRITFIDFGMMGEIPPGTRDRLRQMLIAIATRNAQTAVATARELDVLLPSADIVQLERALSQLFSRFGGLGFAELREVDPREFFDFAIQFRDLVRTLPFQLPKNFLLIIRAVSLTSGVCSGLNPAYNLWDSVEPYAQRLIREQRTKLLGEFASQATLMLRMLWQVPSRVDALLTRLEEGQQTFTDANAQTRSSLRRRATSRLSSAVVFAALALSGTQLALADNWAAMPVVAASLVPLSILIFGRRDGG